MYKGPISNILLNPFMEQAINVVHGWLLVFKSLQIQVILREDFNFNNFNINHF